MAHLAHGTRAPRWALLLVLCMASSLAVSAPGLFVIPTESPSPSALAVADDQPLLVALHVRDPAALAKILGAPAPAAGEDVLKYVMDGYPVISPGTDPRWSESSFVVDYLDPAVAALSRDFAKARGGQAAVSPAFAADLTRFVSGVVKGSNERGLDLASEVATLRTGDCKNYAVLTVALARAAGVPARIVFGIALLRFDDHYGAFGHAWAELRIDGRWIVADSAIAKEPGHVRYLPFGALENEGMGYALDAARLTPVWVQRVNVLGAATK